VIIKIAQDILTKIYELTNAQEGDREKLQGIAAVLTEHLAVREGDDAEILTLINQEVKALKRYSFADEHINDKNELRVKAMSALALRFSARAAREQKLRVTLEKIAEESERAFNDTSEQTAAGRSAKKSAESIFKLSRQATQGFAMSRPGICRKLLRSNA